MTEEENIAFNELKELSEFFDNKGLHTDNQVLVHLIEKLQEENELKDKVIEEMADRIERGLILKDGSCFWYQEREKCEDYDEASYKCNECIKQYFINKVKGEING